MDSLKVGQKTQRIFVFFLAANFFFFSISPLYAQRSIFRSVNDKTGTTQRTGEEKQTSDKIKKDATKPLLDPRSLLGEQPKTLAQSIQIPPEYGRISENYQSGRPTPLIIHIQDVHVHYEAQKNLANMLDKLVKENGLRLILVEGGSGDTSLSFLRAEATQEKRLEVAEKYLKLGKISGEEYLDIISDNTITLWGIEEEEMYDENLDIFFKVDAIKGKALEVIGALKKIVEALKADIYSPALKELEKKKSEYEEGEGQAVDYYQYLGTLSQTHQLDLSRYPNFHNFLAASLLEKQIDFQKVDGQHQALIGKLTQLLSKEDLTALAEKGLKYKLNEAGPGDYYGFLKDILRKSDPAPGTHEDLDRYIDYVLLYAERDHVELFREGKVLEKEIKGELYTSGDERTLSEISDRLDLLDNFLELNLSPDDLAAYRAERHAYLISGWKEFLLAKMGERGVTLPFPKDTAVIDGNMKLLESFYVLGMERDNSLVRNALKKIKDEKVDLAVLIAGGFHTAQITQLLKEKNYSYMVIAPKITQASNLELYHKILKEKAKPETPAEENLRTRPALERGVPRLFEGDVRGKEVQDGGMREFTAETFGEILAKDLRVVVSDRERKGVPGVSIPQGKRVFVIQLREGDANFYAGNFLSKLGEKNIMFPRKTISRSVLEGQDEEGVEELKKELRRVQPDILFLPLLPRDQPHLLNAIRETLEGPALGVFYKSTEIESRVGLAFSFSDEVAQRKKRAVLQHKSQIHRLPYHKIAALADKANAFRVKGAKNVEVYAYATLKNGAISRPKKLLTWDFKTLQKMQRKGTVALIGKVAHSDDIEIMGGGLVHLASKAGLKIRIWILSTGSGAEIRGATRSERAKIRAEEAIKAADDLETPRPHLLGFEIFEDQMKKKHPMPDGEILKKAGERLGGHVADFLSGVFGGDHEREEAKKEVIVLVNDPSDPNPRHRAAHEEAMKVLTGLSKKEKDILFHLVFLTPPETENFNAWFSFKTRREIKSEIPEVDIKAEAARLTAEQLAEIGRELVKGTKPPFYLSRAEAFRIEPLIPQKASSDTLAAQDGTYKGFAIKDLKLGKEDGFIASFSGVRYKHFGMGPGIGIKEEVTARLYGYHYASWVSEALDKKRIRLLVAHDPRPTSQAIRDAQVTGFKVAARGKGFDVKVVDLGVLTTPLVEQALRYLQADGGVMITASHNPIEQNGWKYLSKEGNGALLLPDEMDHLNKGVEGNYEEADEAFFRRLDEVQAPPYAPNETMRWEVIESYIPFAKKTFGLEGERPLRGRIVLDPNGGALFEVGKFILERLGMEVHEIPSVLGRPEYKIEPLAFENGRPTPRYQRLLEEMKAFGAPLGLMPDFDADRGELGFGGQEISAFTVAMTLSDYDLKKTLKEGKTAVVAHAPTSGRTREIASAFGVKVYYVETGEINVVSKMRKLREHYVVPIGVEGVNGGAVFRESTSRDGLFTAILAARALNEPELYLNWLKKRGVPSDRKLSPALESRVQEGRYTLEEVVDSLPKYHTPDPAFGKFTMDHGAFKRAILAEFEEKIGHVGRKEPFTFPGIPGRRYTEYKTEYLEGTEVYPEIRGDGLGDYKITLFDDVGNQTFIQMRGSRTETEKMRYVVDTKFREEVEPLLDLIRSLEMERLGASRVKKEGGAEFYLLADGREVEIDKDLSQLSVSAADGAYKILGKRSRVTGLEKAAYIGPHVVLDARKGKIILQPKVTLMGMSYLKGLPGHPVEIGEEAEVISSFIAGAKVPKKAYIRNHSVLITSPGTKDDWSFDKGGQFEAGGEATVSIGKDSVVDFSYLENSRVGEYGIVRNASVTNSDLGNDNVAAYAKLFSPVKTEADVQFKGRPGSPLEISEAYIGKGARFDQQAFIDSVLHGNVVVEARFNPASGRLKLVRKFEGIPHVGYMGPQAVDSSYLGEINPNKEHENNLFLKTEIDGEKVMVFQGIDGTESSAHGYFKVWPFAVMTDDERWVAMPAGTKPSSDLLEMLQDPNLTQAMPFSVTGFVPEFLERQQPEVDGRDAWSYTFPGAMRYGLGRGDQLPGGVFILSPDTLFKMIQEARNRLPERERRGRKFAQILRLPESQLKTAMALLQKDLHETTLPEQRARLERWIRTYQILLESGVWNFNRLGWDATRGAPVGWQKRDKQWVHPRIDLARIAAEAYRLNPSEYRQYSYAEIKRKTSSPVPQPRQKYDAVIHPKELPVRAKVRVGTGRTQGRIDPTADVHPTAFIGPDVVVSAGAIVGPGTVLLGETFVGEGAEIFATHATHSVFLNKSFTWGSRLKYGVVEDEVELLAGAIRGTKEFKSVVGRGSEIRFATLLRSVTGEKTKGQFFKLVDSASGKNQIFEPFATIVRTVLGDNVGKAGTGSIVEDSDFSGLTLVTGHHNPGRVYGAVARPVAFVDPKGTIYHVDPQGRLFTISIDENGAAHRVDASLSDEEEGSLKEIPNVANLSGGITVGEQGGGKDQVWISSAFPGTNTILKRGSRLEFGVMISGVVEGNETVLPFTFRRPAGKRTGMDTDQIGGALDRTLFMLRGILSKTISAMELKDRHLGAHLMEAMISKGLWMAQEELRRVRSLEASGIENPRLDPETGRALHSEKALLDGMDQYKKHLALWKAEGIKRPEPDKPNGVRFVGEAFPVYHFAGGKVEWQPVRAADGAGKYAAVTPDMPMAYEPLHRRPVSDTTRQKSERLKREGDAVVIILPSSILVEDMGRSLSFTLNQLALETGNPLENEEGVFKFILLIDDPSVSFKGIDNYLKKHNLRREQFFGVVTYDHLEENFGDIVRRNAKGQTFSLTYAEKLEEFLWLSLAEKGLHLRLRENSNVVIVTPSTRVEEWDYYIHPERFGVRKNPLQVKLLVYEPRKPGEEVMNLAPLLITTAVGVAGSANPHEALKDLIAEGKIDPLDILQDKIYLRAIPVQPTYFKGYLDYLKFV